MLKFITVYNNGTNKKSMVNIDSIVYYEEYGGGTWIELTNGAHIDAKETVEEINEKIDTMDNREKDFMLYLARRISG